MFKPYYLLLLFCLCWTQASDIDFLFEFRLSCIIDKWCNIFIFINIEKSFCLIPRWGKTKHTRAHTEKHKHMHAHARTHTRSFAHSHRERESVRLWAWERETDKVKRKTKEKRLVELWWSDINKKSWIIVNRQDQKTRRLFSSFSAWDWVLWMLGFREEGFPAEGWFYYAWTEQSLCIRTRPL